MAENQRCTLKRTAILAEKLEHSGRAASNARLRARALDKPEPSARECFLKFINT